MWGLAIAAAGLAGCGDDSPASPTSPSNGGSDPAGGSGATMSPTVTAITPASGPTAGGTAITITGANFAAGATVTIGGAAATGVTIVGATSITAVTPPHAAAGAADVVVSLNGRAGTLPNAFTYIAVSAQTGNSPPLIARIRARGSRPGIPYQFADLGETITITAEVQDAETPPDQLTYEWKPAAGTITGSGAVVQWRAPDSGTKDYDVTLTVIERYQGTGSNGAPVTLENRATGTTTISVHDSVPEISAMARQFLVDFSTQVAPDLILRNFTVSAGCPKGKAAELDDIHINQTRYKIQQWDIRDPDITINFAGVCRYRGRLGDACAYVPSVWHSLDHQNADTVTIADGTDQITAMYEGNRWWLCDSDFIPRGTNGAIVSPFKK